MLFTLRPVRFVRHRLKAASGGCRTVYREAGKAAAASGGFCAA
jgi:hypothetical protein